MSQEKDRTISFRLPIAAVVAIEQLIKGTDKTLGSYCKHLVLESLGLSDGESTQTAKKFEDVLAEIMKRIQKLEQCMQSVNESVNNTVDNEESSSQLLVNELVNESADTSASGNDDDDENKEVLTDITQTPIQIEDEGTPPQTTKIDPAPGGEVSIKEKNKGNSKLTDSQKTEIVDLYRETEHTASTLAAEFGVNASTISRTLKDSLDPREYTRLIQKKRLQRNKH